VFNRGIANYNLGPVSREFLSDYLAKASSLGEILQNIFPMGTDDLTIETCKTEIKELFRQVETVEVSPFPGVEELFRYLEKKGIKIGIATGRMSSPEDEWGRFKRLGLDRFISAIVTSREVAYRKPAPDVIIECARRLDVPIGSCIAVGDTEPDIIAARKAGAFGVVVASGQGDKDWLLKVKPEIVLRSVSDLVAFFDRMGDQG